MTKRWFSIVLVLILTTACNLRGSSSLHALSKIDTFAHNITFSPDGHLLAIGTLGDGAKIWRITDKALVYSLDHGDIRTIIFSPDGQFVVTAGAGEDSTVSLWRLADSSLIRTFDQSLTSWVQSVNISPDGQQIAVGTNDKVHIFNIADGSRTGTLDTSGVSAVFSPDSKHIAIAENLPVIRIWNIATREIIHTLPGHGLSIAYSPNGELLAAPGWNNQGMVTFQGAETFPTTVDGDKVIQLWNTDDGSPNRALRGHEGQIHSIAFSSDNQFVVSSANDNTVRLWRVTDSTEIGQITVEHNPSSIAFAPDGKTVAVAVWRDIYLWSIAETTQSK